MLQYQDFSSMVKYDICGGRPFFVICCMINRWIGCCLFLLCWTFQSNAQGVIFAQLQGQPNMNTTGWSLTGAAQIGDTPGDADSFNNELVLTTAVNTTSGAIFFDQPIDLAVCRRWIASFEYRIFDGTAADGIAFCFLDVPPTGFVNGGGLGIPATANGLKVVLDTWDNGCGPNPELQVYSGPGYDECFPTLFKVQNTTGQLNFMRSNTYNTVEIVYDSGYIDIKINNVVWASGVFAPAAFTGYVGFTASTGGANDLHSIRNVQIYTDGSDLQGFLGVSQSGNWPVVNGVCDSWQLGLRTQGRFKCNSLDPSGSDFRLYDTNGQLLQIRQAQTIGCVNDRTDSLLLDLALPFTENGLYYLVLRQGVDGNVLEGDCGSALSAFDTVIVHVADCYRYIQPVDMRNVSVATDDERLQLHWAFPDTLRPSVFGAYSLEYQENPGGNWIEWGSFFNLFDTTTAVTAHVPDLWTRDFRVSLLLRGGVRVQAGRPLGNILLKNEDDKLRVNTERTATLSWSAYNRAWQPQRYFLLVKGPQGIDSLALNEDDTLYNYEKSLIPGDYTLEIRTLAPDGRWARSNALEFEVALPEVTVFNVVTPNGDGKNDVFKAEYLEFYPGNQLRVFNRWGQLVFVKQAYQNDWSPTNLEGGNYQYELRLNEQQVLRGSIRIVK